MAQRFQFIPLYKVIALMKAQPTNTMYMEEHRITIDKHSFIIRANRNLTTDELQDFVNECHKIICDTTPPSSTPQ